MGKKYSLMDQLKGKTLHLCSCWMFISLFCLALCFFLINAFHHIIKSCMFLYLSLHRKNSSANNYNDAAFEKIS